MLVGKHTSNLVEGEFGEANICQGDVSGTCHDSNTSWEGQSTYVQTQMKYTLLTWSSSQRRKGEGGWGGDVCRVMPLTVNMELRA